MAKKTVTQLEIEVIELKNHLSNARELIHDLKKQLDYANRTLECNHIMFGPEDFSEEHEEEREYINDPAFKGFSNEELNNMPSQLEIRKE